MSRKGLPCHQHSPGGRTYTKEKPQCNTFTNRGNVCKGYAIEKDRQGDYVCRVHRITSEVCEGVTNTGLYCKNPLYKGKQETRNGEKYCYLHYLYAHGICMAETKTGKYCKSLPYKYGDGYCYTHRDKEVEKILKEIHQEEKDRTIKAHKATLDKKALRLSEESAKLYKINLERDALLNMIRLSTQTSFPSRAKDEIFEMIFNKGYREVKGTSFKGIEKKSIEYQRDAMISILVDLFGNQKSSKGEDMYNTVYLLAFNDFRTRYKKMKKMKKFRKHKIPSIHDVYNKILIDRKEKRKIESEERKKKEKEQILSGITTKEEIAAKKVKRRDELRVYLRKKYNIPKPRKLKYSGDIGIEREFSKEYFEITQIDDDIGECPKVTYQPKSEWKTNNKKFNFHPDDTIMLNPDRDRGLVEHDKDNELTLRDDYPLGTYNQHREESDIEYCEIPFETVQPFLHYTSPFKRKVCGLDYEMRYGLKIHMDRVGDFDAFIAKCIEIDHNPVDSYNIIELYAFEKQKPREWTESEEPPREAYKKFVHKKKREAAQSG
uniref:Uncharacterized protein n=1 Tax=Pithovirus LCPAC403 TaxID=2506596 RepID=A0A481ZB93_9VIRU|nr:MAG: uncharacterized protein LCPAC403_01810 [Pithovirus LCPAC403]